MCFLAALALALPPEVVRASGGPATGVLTASVLVAALLVAALLCWWAWPARQSAHWLAGVCLLVIERSPLAPHLALADEERPGRMRRMPGPDRAEPPNERSTPTRLHQTERETLRRAGFTPTQIERLLLYRQAYRAGHYQPDPTAPARLHFARWLYQHGRLNE